MMEIKDQDLEVWVEALIPLKCLKCFSVEEEEWEEWEALEVLEVWMISVMGMEVGVAVAEIKNIPSDLDDNLLIVFYQFFIKAIKSFLEKRYLSFPFQKFDYFQENMQILFSF
jgi:hypothetical protein